MPACWGEDRIEHASLRLDNYDWVELQHYWIGIKRRGSDVVEYESLYEDQDFSCALTEDMGQPEGCDDHGYALDSEGRVWRWSVIDQECVDLTHVELEGDFWKLHCFREHGLCGLEPSGEVVCLDGSVLEERYHDVQTGLAWGDCDDEYGDCYFECGLSIDGTISCWGDPPNYLGAPEGSDFVRLGVGRMANICGLTSEGELRCSLTPDYESRSYTLQAPAEVVELGVGHGYACVLDVTGQVTCLADSTWEWALTEDLPTSEQTEVAVGSDQSCALDAHGQVSCWGSTYWWGSVEQPFEGTYTQVAASPYTRCALRESGEIECYTYDDREDPEVPRAEALSLGVRHGCSLDASGQPWCWPIVAWWPDFAGASDPPEGLELVHISAGNLHTCGITAEGEVVCWGDDSYGQSSAPEGRFQQVSAGGFHTCAIRDTGELDCWGWDYFGQASPPDGTFSQVAAGRWHTCAVDTEGDHSCWGANESGQLTPR